MNLNSLYFFFCLVGATSAFGEINYFPVAEGLTLPESSMVLDCSIGSIRLSVENQHILISTNSSELTVDIDEVPDEGEIVLGDFTGDGFCDLAMPYGRSDVNESYTLLLHDPSQEKLTKSKIGTIINPEFQTKKILSSYREAARRSKETLCYSEQLRDFFLCEIRTGIDESLESLTVCSESICSSSIITYKQSSIQASAVVIAKQARFHDKLDDRSFTERKGYLVKGDKVYLLDFFQSHDAFYYKVVYGDKASATGWIKDSQLAISPKENKQN